MQLHELERDLGRERQKNQARDGRKGVPRAQGTTEKEKVDSCTKSKSESVGGYGGRPGREYEHEEERKLTVAVVTQVSANCHAYASTSKYSYDRASSISMPIPDSVPDKPRPVY